MPALPGIARRILRGSAVAILVVYTIALYRGTPGLDDPTLVGSDTYNYHAAAQRLNDGHKLYEVGPGDMPTRLQPQFYSVALVSPPPIAVLWRPLALLPNDLGAWVWWTLVAVTTLGASAWFMLKGSVAVVAASLILIPELAYTALSGNVNAFVLVGVAAVWLADRADRQGIAGGILAALVAIKVLPLLLLAWFIAQRRWRSLQWFAAWSLTIGLLSVLGAGFQSHLEWLTNTSNQPSLGYPASLPAIAATIGVPSGLLPGLIPATAFLALLAAWQLRTRPAATFAILVAATVFCNPTSHAGSYALLLPALTPWTGGTVAARRSSHGVTG
ncbi:MAG: glycosyltransferase family 87 protein [Candidatus Limnocylindrales bacterium]